MSSRRRFKRPRPEVAAFIESARTIGYVVTDRVLERWAKILLIGFRAPDTSDLMMVEELLDAGTFGDRDSVCQLVDVGRICLLGGE